jgi:cytoskeletal protein RodZ
MSDVGKILKDARVDKGLTLDDLQQITKIQKRYLIAIEDENFDALPGTFYVKAFIRQYAETVGLDPDIVLEDLAEKLGENNQVQEPKQPTSRAQLREKKTDDVESSLNKLVKYLPTAIVVVIVIAIVGTIYFVTYGNNKKNSQDQIDTSQKVSVSSEVTKKKKDTTKTKESNKQSSTKKETKTKKDKTTEKQTITSTATSGTTFTYSLKSSAKQNKISFADSGSAAWSAIYADGVQQWQGTLNDGQVQDVTLPENVQTIKISLGNSKATTIKINGKDFNFMNENADLTVRQIVINVENSNQSQDATQE